MLEGRRIAFIGCGNMGEAIMRRLLESGVVAASQLSVAEKTPERQAYLKDTYQVQIVPVDGVASGNECIFVAIKPQQLASLPVYEVQPGTTVVSILAGTPVEKIKEHFPGAQVVRTMPNLGYTVGNSVTGVFFDSTARWQEDQLGDVHHLLSTGGITIEVDAEEKLNAITAVAGSGPAYYYWFAEQMAKAAQNLGFDDTDAEKIAREVLIGAAKVLEANPSITVSEWRERVTSKGGTTEAALNVLNASNAGVTTTQAAEAARDRSRELSV